MTATTITAPATMTPPGTVAAARHPRTPAEVAMPTRRRPGHTIVALRGDLDSAAAPALREHLIGVLGHSSRLLTLDLSEVSFCDAAGLAVLIGARRRAGGLGITLNLAAPNPQVTKLLSITRVDRVLAVHPAPSPSQAITRAA